MKGTRLFLVSLFFLVLLSTSSARSHKKIVRGEPCKRLVLFFHDILEMGDNAANATSAIVGVPEWANNTSLGPQNHFGDMIVFYDPVTLDNNLHSPPVGYAQGFYFYDRKDVLTAWFYFTFVFNSTDYKGTLTLVGPHPLKKTSEFSVIGGSEDFFMTRGIATVSTGSFEGDVYFRLRLDIKLYECY